MSWQPELDELRRREAFARELGGPDKVKRQKQIRDAKLAARERKAKARKKRQEARAKRANR